MPDSWVLKLERAEKHLAELRLGLLAYVERTPYEAFQIHGGPRCRQHPAGGFRYGLRIIEQPDPKLAIVAGDVVHNVRSALDHLAVSVAPSSRHRNASFPIQTQPIWRKDGRSYVVRDSMARRHWRAAVSGMSADACRFIESLQPYHDSRPDQSVLALLSRLENADKHRQLNVLTVGLTKITVWGTARGRTKELTIERPEHFVTEDGEELAHFYGRGGPALRNPEVDVQVRGTPLITTKVAELDKRKGRPAEFMPLGELLESIIATVRGAIFPGLEPFVVRHS
jgi:hypothetical protein